MNLATNLLIVYVIYFCLTYYKIFSNPSLRKSHQSLRRKLEELRKISLKTQEQQKEFLDLKYPKKPFFKWTFKNVLKAILKIGIMIIVFLIINKLWARYIIFEFKLWQVILIIVIIPILLNTFLKRYNLQQDDILIFFK